MIVDRSGAQFMAAALLRRFEGLRLAPYFCPAGKPTIGYGHVILSDENEYRRGISLDIAEYLLQRDLAWAMFEARDVGRVLTDGQAAALASLVYNIGPHAWRKSTIRARVVAGDYAGAAREFSRWNKVDGVVSAGLVARRAAEKKLFGGEDGLD